MIDKMPDEPTTAHEAPDVRRDGLLELAIEQETDLGLPIAEAEFQQHLERLWDESPEIYHLLQDAQDVEQARSALVRFLTEAEQQLFTDEDIHELVRAKAHEAVAVLRGVLAPINEKRTGFSALEALWRLARQRGGFLKLGLTIGFLMEFTNIFRGVNRRFKIWPGGQPHANDFPEFMMLVGREAAEARMEMLDNLGARMRKYFHKYPSGLSHEVRGWRRENRRRVLKYFNASSDDWNDYRWHLDHVIRDPAPLLKLVDVTEQQAEAVKRAQEHGVPFGITPFYLSLMDKTLNLGYDHAIRAQVIPPPDYVDQMVAASDQRCTKFDFMGEADTSPVDLVTRRYPGIAILKPYNSCAQICVYCQRNWEIEQCMDPDALAPEDKLEAAIQWFADHPSVGEVLITGGDPLVMDNAFIRKLLESFAKIRHIYRIRFGTRTLVVLPMRWTDELVALLQEYHEPGWRQIAVVTHFEHSYEITPEAMEAVTKIRRAGISVYNQEVFTVENSRRFESAKLRRDLKFIGIDPYYTFNAKGKIETRRYRVPIARILQERREEARLLPGLDRTDEPVFNVPRLGKNHLRGWQDHQLIMVRPNGGRVYAFHPWEKNLQPVPPYVYDDVPIYDYLRELASRGEHIIDYRTIWTYY